MITRKRRGATRIGCTRRTKERASVLHEAMEFLLAVSITALTQPLSMV
jgi:hypothetical protein